MTKERGLEAQLRELREDAPPPSLAARLERAIPTSGALAAESSGWRVPRSARWAAVAVVVITVSAVLPHFHARRTALLDVLDPVAHATGNAEAVHVVLSARTREGEDFAYVQVDGAMQRIEAWLENPHHAPGGRARIQKDDRVYVFDGRETTRYLRRGNEALRFAGGGVEAEAFWPAGWVQLVAKAAPSSVQVLAQGDEGDTARVLVFEKGVSSAPLPPSFLHEFDRETELVWDRRSERLLSMRRWVRRGGTRVLVAATESVDYLPVIPDERFQVELAGGVRWIGLAQASDEVARMTPVQVARTFFEAGGRGDRDVLAMICPSPGVIDYLVENSPIEVLSIGEPIRKASYPGVLVPYQVRLKNGAILDHRLALRNDNAERRWEFDGGL
jgi:hypothetical protein